MYNHLVDDLDSCHIREHERTSVMFRTLAHQQHGYDIFVVPDQFGFRHDGRPVRRARDVFAENEFCLGAFAVGIMLLTHPEREVGRKQLHVDCAGDELAPFANGDFSFAPIFRFNDGEVMFGAGHYYCAHEPHDSASAFLQNQRLTTRSLFNVGGFLNCFIPNTFPYHFQKV